MSDKAVLDDLLNKTRYDKRLRPPAPAQTIEDAGSVQTTDSSFECDVATMVNVSILVLSLFSPDESSLKYEVEFLMHQHWYDLRLAFKSYNLAAHYVHLNGIHHQDEIWIPDTYFIKHGDFKQTQLPTNIALRIFREGLVTYTIRRLLSLSCEGDLNIFPFDNPTCVFSMESVSHERHEMVYHWNQSPPGTGSKSKPLDFVKDFHQLNAYIITNVTEETCNERLAWRGNYSCLKVNMTFTRDRSFYFSTVFIPGMLLVTSSFITFWLEWNAVPGRVMLGVTTMLNFFTTSNNFRSNLPVVSNLTAMNVWDGVCMCFIYASLLEFVTVNYLGRKRPQPLKYYRPVSGGTIVSTENANSKETYGDAQEKSGICTSCMPNDCMGDGQALRRLSRKPPPPPPAPPEPPMSNNKDNGGQQSRVPSLHLSHPLQVAKTIDVVSRVVFPVAYGVFLIFFFAKYMYVQS